jgi:hypothetical protein
MPSYDICYLDSTTSLCCQFTAQCADHKHACILAHAMRLNSCKSFEVWSDEVLIYARPYPDSRVEVHFKVSGPPLDAVVSCARIMSTEAEGHRSVRPALRGAQNVDV